MPRIRSLKPEIWLSPQVMNLSRDGRLLFIGLITQADDEGRGVADPRKLKAAIFPGDDDIGSTRVLELQQEISQQGLAVFYNGNGHGRLCELVSFTSHQSINRPSKSRYPEPPKDVAFVHSRNGHGALSEDSLKTPEGSEGSEGSYRKDLTRARDPVDNGDKSARTARGKGRLKKHSDPKEIEKRRREAADIAARLAAGAKP